MVGNDQNTRSANTSVKSVSRLVERITNLVEDERGNAGRNERVPNPQVPRHPMPLKPVKLGKVYIQASVEL